jgi:hypothetical protein
VRRIIVGAVFFMAACAPPPPTELVAKGGAELAGHAVKMLEAGGRGHLIRIVLYGMAGPIEVSGKRYDAIMTPLRYLKDQQVADVLNHVLTSWGNDALLPRDFKPITPEEVRQERAVVLSPREIAAERPRL